MSQFTIQQIFQDNWNNFVIDNPNILIRDSIFDEVNKVINCGNPDFGYAIYICEHCGKFLKVPFRCKSRFCNTCGVKYAQDRALSMSKKSFRCKHRHIVFTMSDKLWPYFQKYRFLLNGLFWAASNAVLSWFHDLNKSQNFTPGLMCTLHTFGRDLKWNPHIHMLCTEGAAGNTEVFRIVSHINFKALRFRWQKLILDYLSKHLPAYELPHFKKIKNDIYKNFQNGFYVYAKPDNISSIKQTINYVVRYTGRPAMAQSRILNYYGQYVTYYYERHEDGKRIEETIHVYEFIKRLIKHIPDKNFKVVRYYGIYSKEHKQSKKIFRLLNSNQIMIRQILRKWNLSISLAFGYDPTICSCGGKFIFFDLKIPGKKILKHPLSRCIIFLGDTMSKKKNILPFSNVIDNMKHDFKKMIDEMPDEEFLDLLYFLMETSADFEDEDWLFDEEWKAETEKFYNQNSTKKYNNKNKNNFKLIDNDDSLPL